MASQPRADDDAKNTSLLVLSRLPREVVSPLLGRSLNNKNTHKIINKLLYNGIHMIYDIYHTPYHGITVGEGNRFGIKEQNK